MTTNTALNSLQLATAHRLAAAYGHSWAIEATRILRTPVTPAQIQAALQKATPAGEMLGIEAPTLDDRGFVVHTTASGRLRWTVYRDGSVKLDICRPDGVVLAATVDRKGATSMVVTRPCFSRHWEALLAAVKAAGGSQDVVKAAAPGILIRAWAVLASERMKAQEIWAASGEEAFETSAVYKAFEAEYERVLETADAVIARVLTPLPPRTAAQRHAQG